MKAFFSPELNGSTAYQENAMRTTYPRELISACNQNFRKDAFNLNCTSHVGMLPTYSPNAWCEKESSSKFVPLFACLDKFSACISYL